MNRIAHKWNLFGDRINTDAQLVSKMAKEFIDAPKDKAFSATADMKW